MIPVWPKVKLSSLYTGLYDGPHATPKESEEGAVFLGIKNVTESGQLDLSEIRHIAKDDMAKWTKRVLPEKDDIVFSYEATLHRYARIPEGFYGCLGRRMALIRLNKSKVDIDFLFAYFLGPVWRCEVEKHILSGATVDRIPLTSVPNFEVHLPPLSTQQKIARILSAYDDLIENNQKRIKLLEEMAQLTYEEWFVRMKFPGYEDVPVDTETGLPEGWSIENFTDVIDFKEGPGLRNWQYREAGIPFLNIRVLKGNEIDFSIIKYLDSNEVKQKYEHFLLKENDHVISTSGTLGRMLTIRSCHLPLCLNTSIIRMREKSARMGKWQIKHILSSQLFQAMMDVYANGAAQVNFGPMHLKQIKLKIPPLTVAKHYEQHVGSLEEGIKNILDQNIALKEARDILLPRLMTGLINVDEIEMPQASEVA